MKKNICYLVGSLFVLLALMIIGNEIFCIPSKIFGTPPTPVNLGEAAIELSITVIMGFIAVYLLNNSISRRMIAEKDRDQLIGKLRKYDKLKSKFVGDVAHEILNPLSTLRLSFDYLSLDIENRLEPRQRDMVQNAIRSVDRLTRLTRDLLDITKIESGKMNLDIASFDICALADEVLINNERLMSEKRLTFTKEYKQCPCILEADRDKIYEVFLNLLGNSIKYTPAGGKISVRIDNIDGRLRFEISDNGPGIPETYKEKVFDMFERVTPGKSDGMGLGLSIAKSLVELHKGRLWVESDGISGSAFIFTLPMK